MRDAKVSALENISSGVKSIVSGGRKYLLGVGLSAGLAAGGCGSNLFSVVLDLNFINAYCSDSSPATSQPAPEPEELCSNTCIYAFDGDCDDGGPNSDYSFCDLGTDCGDCGPRFVGE
jgi:hypothetical protein